MAKNFTVNLKKNPRGTGQNPAGIDPEPPKEELAAVQTEPEKIENPEPIQAEPPIEEDPEPIHTEPPIEEDQEPVQTETPTAEVPVPVQTETPKEKKKPGRKKVKKGEYKTINISVEVSVLEKMEIAKLKYGNNLTAYVNALIAADLDANYQKYLEIQEYLNK